MATDLETRPDEDQDAIQQRYDDTFNSLTSKEHLANDGTPGDIGDGSESGFFRNEDEPPKSSGIDTSTASSKSDSTESAGGSGLFRNEDETNRARSFFRRHRRSIVTGAGGLGFGGGALVLFSVLSGPFQAINYGNILGKPQMPQHNAVAGRLTKEIRWAKTGNVGETRLTSLGSFINKRVQADFAKQGIAVQNDRLTGQMKTVTIDLSKSAKYGSMSPEEAAKAFAADNNIPEKNVRKIGGLGKGKIAASVSGLSDTNKRALLRGFVQEKNLGPITSSMRVRVLAKFYNAPSWFHPLKKISAATDRKAALALRTKAKESESKRLKSLVEKSDKVKAFNASLRDKVKPGTAQAVGGALIATAALCVAKDVAHAIPEINRYNVVLPAVQSAGDAISVADQVSEGEDVDLFAAGAYLDSFTDKDGKTPWQSEGIQKLQDPDSKGGAAMDEGMGQAFSPDSKAVKVEKTLNAMGAGLACSTIGKVVQFVGGAALLLTGAGGVVEKAVQAGIGVAAGIAIGHLANDLANYLAEDPVTKTPHQGALGGNLDAYGALELANSAARLQGGTALTAQETAQLTADQQKEEAEDFASKSFIARVFDPRDYHSLAGKVIDSQSPDTLSNVGTVFNGTLNSFTNIGSFFTKLSSAFVPKAAAAENNGWYNLGFNIQQYGFSESDLDSPLVENPYDNAEAVARALGKPGDGQYDSINSRMQICFGMQLTQDSEGKLSVIPVNSEGDGGPNPQSIDYDNEGNCDDKSELWTRVRFFIMDTGSLTAYACYEGDEQSCTDLGINNTSSTAAAAGAGSKLRIATFNVRGASHPEKGSVDYRAKGGADFIKKSGFQVVGLQELQTNQGQRDAYVKYLGSNWDFWPGKNAQNTHHSVENSITWDTTYFTSVDSGIITNGYHYFNNEKLFIPWVKLQDKSTGQEFIVESTHDPTDSGGNFDLIRSANAEQHLKDAQNWAKQGLPVFIVGDFNSTFYLRTSSGVKDDLITREQLPYCIMTKTGELLNAFDVFRKVGNPVGKNCPTEHTKEISKLAGQYGNLIDHVYITPQVQISDQQWSDEPEKANPRYTDHPVMWVDAVIPGSGASIDSFETATYNIEHAVSFPDANCLPSEKRVRGDYEHGYIRPACIERRSSAQANIILGRGDATNPKLDIVGLQEVSRPQYTALKQDLPTYDAVPSLANLPKARGTAIFWDKTKFQKASEGVLRTYDNAGDLRDIPWVQLTAGSKSTYVISVHAQNNANGGSVALRAKMEQDVVNWAKTKKNATSSVLVMGDFNNGKDRTDPNVRNTMYCTMTADLVLFKLFDFAKDTNITKPCPYPITGPSNMDNDQFRSDQIFIGPIAGMTASGWTHAPDSGLYSRHISDHQPVYAKVSLSGSNN